MAVRQMGSALSAISLGLLIAGCPQQTTPELDGGLGAVVRDVDGGPATSDAGHDAGTPPVDAGGGPPLTVCATQHPGWLNRNSSPPDLIELEDLTGDGVRDGLMLAPADAGQQLLRIGNGGSTILFEEFAVYVKVAAAFVNDDAQADLVVSSPWLSEVRVFLGPLSGARLASGANHLFTQSNPPGALENLFGYTFVVVDFNGDGVKDVVVSTPGEGEEACAAQEPPRVFFGPFDGGTYTGNDAALELDAPLSRCLGETTACVSGGFRLFESHTDVDGGYKCHQWDLPTVDAGAVACR